MGWKPKFKGLKKILKVVPKALAAVNPMALASAALPNVTRHGMATGNWRSGITYNLKKQVLQKSVTNPTSAVVQEEEARAAATARAAELEALANPAREAIAAKRRRGFQSTILTGNSNLGAGL